DFSDPDSALKYYVERLAQLEKHSKNLNGNYFFLESDALINHTDEILEELRAFLNLESPLSSSYTIFQKTNQPGYGDFSDNISTGKIVKRRNENLIDLPQSIVDAGHEAYERCISLLSNSKRIRGDPLSQLKMTICSTLNSAPDTF
ncbi:MAG: hypothetical protein AAF633_19285, partial [Chloroflexota bacterium]